MARSELRPRTQKFHWETRQELYSFFKERQGIEAKDLDAKIEEAIQSFRLRQGQAIRPMELWQKVGMNLVRQFGIILPGEESSPTTETPAPAPSRKTKSARPAESGDEFIAEVDLP